jgi:hypothetical protein
MFVSPEKKLEVWVHVMKAAISKEYRMPVGVTVKRLQKVYDDMMNDEFLWDDVVCRHGLLHMSIDELKATDKETYEHCIGNFWGMVSELMWKKGILK